MVAGVGRSADGHERILSGTVVNKGADLGERGQARHRSGPPHRSSTHGLGFELDQSRFMGKLATPAAFGHTGFAGTSLLVAPRHGLVLVLLTNRARPSWSWSNPDTPNAWTSPRPSRTALVKRRRGHCG